MPMTADDAVLLDFPNEIETVRLRIRAPRPGDGATVNAAIIETLDDLRRFPSSLPWAMEEPTIARSELYCRRGAGHWLQRTDLPMLMFERTSGEYAGGTGLHRFDWSHGVFEIGWWCRKRFQGCGLVTEAAAAVSEFAFKYLHARRVWCAGDEENPRSWRVAERAGFRLEGCLVSERADPDGTRRNMRVYALTR
jgi:RimJ/RimL family protein N-acetyltransferase